MKDNKTLQRYELKYFLTKEVANEIKEHVNKFMILDKYATFYIQCMSNTENIPNTSIHMRRYALKHIYIYIYIYIYIV